MTLVRGSFYDPDWNAHPVTAEEDDAWRELEARRGSELAQMPAPPLPPALSSGGGAGTTVDGPLVARGLTAGTLSSSGLKAANAGAPVAGSTPAPSHPANDEQPRRAHAEAA